MGTERVRDGLSTGCRWGLTLPLGLLHIGASLRTAAIPPPSSSSGLGRMFTSTCFQVTFLGAFANSAEVLQGSPWVRNSSSGQGDFLLPEEMMFIAGFAAGFDVEFAAVSPLPYPASLNTSGTPEPSLFLHLSFCLLLCFLFSLAASSDNLQDQPELPHAQSSLTKAPVVSIIPLLVLQSGAGAGLLFSLQISNNW